jgi:hypothetical protein
MDLTYTRPEDETLRDQVERFIAREVLRKMVNAGMRGLMFAPDHVRQPQAFGAPLFDRQAVRQKVAMLDEAAKRC